MLQDGLSTKLKIVAIIALMGITVACYSARRNVTGYSDIRVLQTADELERTGVMSRDDFFKWKTMLDRVKKSGVTKDDITWVEGQMANSNNPAAAGYVLNILTYGRSFDPIDRARLNAILVRCLSSNERCEEKAACLLIIENKNFRDVRLSPLLTKLADGPDQGVRPFAAKAQRVLNL